MTEQNTLVAQIKTRLTEFEAAIGGLTRRVAEHGALLEIATGIAEGHIECADAKLKAAATELVDYLNSPEKWPVLVEAII